MVFKHLVHKTNSEILSGNIQGARPLWPACPPPQAKRDNTVHCWTARYPARRDTTTRPVEPLSLPQKLAVSPPSPRYFYWLRHQPAKLIPRTSTRFFLFVFTLTAQSPCPPARPGTPPPPPARPYWRRSAESPRRGCSCPGRRSPPPARRWRRGAPPVRPGWPGCLPPWSRGRGRPEKEKESFRCVDRAKSRRFPLLPVYRVLLRRMTIADDARRKKESLCLSPTPAKARPATAGQDR